MATALAETPGSPTFRLDPRRCVPIRRVVSSITGRRVISFWIIRSILRAFLNGAPRFSFEVYMSPKYKYEPFWVFVIKDSVFHANWFLLQKTLSMRLLLSHSDTKEQQTPHDPITLAKLAFPFLRHLRLSLSRETCHAHRYQTK